MTASSGEAFFNDLILEIVFILDSTFGSAHGSHSYRHAYLKWPADGGAHAYAENSSTTSDFFFAFIATADDDTYADALTIFVALALAFAHISARVRGKNL